MKEEKIFLEYFIAYSVLVTTVWVSFLSFESWNFVSSRQLLFKTLSGIVLGKILATVVFSLGKIRRRSHEIFMWIEKMNEVIAQNLVYIEELCSITVQYFTFLTIASTMVQTLWKRELYSFLTIQKCEFFILPAFIKFINSLKILKF